MVALNQHHTISAEELMPQLIVDDASLLYFMRSVLAGVDKSIAERTLKPFVIVEGLTIGSFEPARQFILISGEWSSCTYARKVEIMQSAGRQFTAVGRIVPRSIVHVCWGYATPYNPADRRPLPEREQQLPAVVAIGSTVDGRVIYATKTLVKDGDDYRACARTPWSEPTVFRPSELPEPDRLMEGFWHGYKSAKFSAG